jgi:L-threonylcarbamoyladenylate synthase
MNPSFNYKEDIESCLKVLKSGGIILYPTDTIWGIGCDACNTTAVQKVYELKKRSDTKSMLVLVDQDFRISSYVKEIPEVAWELLDVSDKPMTIIYPGAKNLANNLIAEDGTIGIRVSKDPFNQDLIRKFGRPLVSTSANISGTTSPSHFSEISKDIIQNVDFVVKYRQDEISNGSGASSIIKLGVGGEIQIIRQ